MLSTDTIDEIVEKLTPAKTRKLYLGVGNGEELFSDYFSESDPNSFYLGIEANPDSLQIAKIVYKSFDPNLQKRISFFQRDATKLPREFFHEFDQITINYPWEELSGDFSIWNLYSFLSKEPSAPEYLHSLLREDGKVLIRIHPDNQERVEKIKENFGNGPFTEMNISPLPDHAKSPWGDKYVEHQRSPTTEIELLY